MKWTSGSFVLLILGATGGFLGFRAVVGAERKNPLAEISPAFLYIDLDEEGVLVTRSTPFVAGQVPNEKRRVFQWAQPTFRGELEKEVVGTIIQAGRAESLEGRLSTEARRAMASSMASFDVQLKEMVILVEEENKAVKEKLRTRKGRHVLLRTRPFEGDAAFPEFAKMNTRAQGGKGVVWGDLHSEGALQLLILWEEWPGLKKLHDRRGAMLEQRSRRVRRWIEKAYSRKAMTLFGP